MNPEISTALQVFSVLILSPVIVCLASMLSPTPSLREIAKEVKSAPLPADSQSIEAGPDNNYQKAA
jgi:hypothetical protein